MWRAYMGLVRKEFLQVIRDANMLKIIFAVPVIQLLILGYAANTEVKRIDLDIYDFDQSQSSHALSDAMRAGDYFIPTDDVNPMTAWPVFRLDERFQNGKSEMALIIPNDFSQRLDNGTPVSVALITDGSNASSAGTGMGYATRIINRFQAARFDIAQPLGIRYKILFNPEEESIYFMVPAIVAALLTMITVMLTSMSIVREKEVGTLEQLVVTPISGPALLAGKLTTFAVLGLFEMILALAVGIIWFGIPFAGSPPLLFALSALYLVSTLGMGLFFSTITSTQQQAMFYAWFFSVFAFLMSGFLTPIYSMPEWVRAITYLNPMRYFVNIVRGIMMRGSSATDLIREIYPLMLYGIVIFTIAAVRFRKRAA